MNSDPQRVVLILSDESGLERRSLVVSAMENVDIPFAAAVVGPATGFSGIRALADALPELIRRYKPHAIHVSLGHADLVRRTQDDGKTYKAETFAAIETGLQSLIDAPIETAMCDFVIATATPVDDRLQDDIRMGDVERLNGIIRLVAADRDVLVDRVDVAIPREEPQPLEPDGHTLSESGKEVVARSAARAIAEVLVRAEHPWRQIMRSNLAGDFDGIKRARHPELS